MAPTLLAAILFAVAGAICVGLVIVGLPGSWMVLGLAALIELCDPMWAGQGFTSFGWGWIGLGVAMAGVGEVIEFGSGLLGAKAGGASRKGMFGALAGGFLGALFGTFILPIPVAGTLVGAFLGTFSGAMLGEMSSGDGRTARESLKPALAATAAHAVGLAAKIGIATGVWVGLSVVAFAG